MSLCRTHSRRVSSVGGTPSLVTQTLGPEKYTLLPPHDGRRDPGSAPEWDPCVPAGLFSHRVGRTPTGSTHVTHPPAPSRPEGPRLDPSGEGGTSRRWEWEDSVNSLNVRNKDYLELTRPRSKT